MSRRTGRGTQNDNGDLMRDAEAEAAATTNAIAGLRNRLRRPDATVHPGVRGELLKLEEDLAALLEEPGRKPGRHRSQPGRAPARHETAQADGRLPPAAKPDPATASTPGELLTVLWDFKNWSPKTSWRKMAARAGQLVVHSTMYNQMHGDALPKLEVVRAVVIGCGGSAADVEAFTVAWSRISASTGGQAECRELLPAPLQLVPSS